MIQNPTKHPLWAEFLAWDRKRNCGTPSQDDPVDMEVFEAYVAGTERLPFGRGPYPVKIYTRGHSNGVWVASTELMVFDPYESWVEKALRGTRTTGATEDAAIQNLLAIHTKLYPQPEAKAEPPTTEPPTTEPPTTELIHS